MNYSRILLCSSLFCIACGNDEGATPVEINNNGNLNNQNNLNNLNNGTNQNNESNGELDPADEREKAIVDGFSAPQQVNAAAETGLGLTVESVVIASLAANGGTELVTVGTLTQTAQQFDYSAQPADRLIIDWESGPDTEIFVTQLEGDFEAETVEAFFGRNHNVRARLVRDGAVDFEVGSVKSGGTVEGAIIGDITSDNVTYSVNLQKSGTTNSEVGTTINYASDSTMVGTISAPGIELIAEETFTYKHVFVDNNVIDTTRTANSRWTHNGKDYSVNGVLIRTTTVDGWPSEGDFWRAEGTITEDGAVVGQVQFDINEVSIDILLVFENGRKVLLDQHLRRQE